MTIHDEQAAAQAAADEFRDPGCTARKVAAQERERIVREARRATEAAYRAILTTIVQGEKPDPTELTRLTTALNKSPEDVSSDMEEREAELADEAEARRVEGEKAEIEQQIAAQDSLIEQAQAESAAAAEKRESLKAEIERQHAKVAVREKAQLRKAWEKEQAATDSIREATEAIHQLRSQLQNARPHRQYKDRLLTERHCAKRRAESAASDRSMQRYVFAQQQDELPPDALHAALNPPAPNDPTIQHLGGRPVKLGVVNGEEVTIEVGRLG